MNNETITYDGHDYTIAARTGHIYDSAGQFQGQVFKSECGEYWIGDGDTCTYIHENENQARKLAILATITGNYW